MKAVLEGRYEEIFTTMGLCCSSWVATSQGSTKRSLLTPMGWSGYEKVESANKMCSRTWVVFFGFCYRLVHQVPCLLLGSCPPVLAVARKSYERV